MLSKDFTSLTTLFKKIYYKKDLSVLRLTFYHQDLPESLRSDTHNFVNGCKKGPRQLAGYENHLECHLLETDQIPHLIDSNADKAPVSYLQPASGSQPENLLNLDLNYFSIDLDGTGRSTRPQKIYSSPIFLNPYSPTLYFLDSSAST